MIFFGFNELIFKKEFEGPIGFWQIIAQNRNEWHELEDDFVNLLN